MVYGYDMKRYLPATLIATVGLMLVGLFGITDDLLSLDVGIFFIISAIITAVTETPNE